MTKAIFKNIFIAAIISVAVSAILIMTVMYRFFNARILTELKNEAAYISLSLPLAGETTDYLDTLAKASKDMRITLIDQNGGVIYDNIADPLKMESHLNRPEVIAALESGSGESRRYSDTLFKQTLYYAVRLDDHSILRLSTTQKSVLGLTFDMLMPLALIITAMVLLLGMVASGMAKTIIRPINKLNLEEPIANEVYDEITPLLLRLSEQKKRIDRQLRQLSERRDELVAITDNMSEGLLMLGTNSEILSINRSGRELFSTAEEECIGKHMFVLSRNLALQAAVIKAQRGAKSEAVMQLEGRSYQILASPVLENGSISGVVLLFLDVTEKQNAEKLRREFSANVSHELKTPLTSISGYAEIIKNGVAKHEDIAGFAGRIYDEAARLINLVDDIMKLSQLDENRINSPREHVELLQLCKDVCARLEPLAKKHSVNMRVTGSEASVHGVRSVLDEMVYNLVENAIKYNRENGLVCVNVDGSQGASLTVTDTGIGISPEHRPHVFERFYRADKSHSRETGGTGLGLSIVKHAAMFHDAIIELKAAQGKGTSVSVRFRNAPAK